MRTTLDLDPAVLEAARQLARHRSQSLGRMASELMLKGLRSEAPVTRRNGFPVFAAAPDSKPITLQDVQRAEDDG